MRKNVDYHFCALLNFFVCFLAILHTFAHLRFSQMVDYSCDLCDGIEIANRLNVLQRITRKPFLECPLAYVISAGQFR